MPAKKAAKKTRSDRRAPGQTQTSISISEDLLAKAKKIAKDDKRSFSNWLERLIQEKLE